MKSLCVVIPVQWQGHEQMIGFDQDLPFLQSCAAAKSVHRLQCSNFGPELFGLHPDFQMPTDGVLAVSALNADPPATSVHFKLDVASLVDGVTNILPVSEDECRAVLSATNRLNTRKLTQLAGFGDIHGLVWEDGSIDMNCQPLKQGDAYLDHLPVGDGEKMLRRFIDDSINLLNELELNRRRTDEGRPPLNLLWPHSPGFRLPIPNLALQRGTPGLYGSQSYRVSGFAKLAGYRHVRFNPLSRLLELDWKTFRETVNSPLPSVFVFGGVRALQSQGMDEESAWLLRQIDSGLQAQIADLLKTRENTISLLFPSPGGGLALMDVAVEEGNSGNLPLSEPLHLDERLPVTQMGKLIESCLKAR